MLGKGAAIFIIKVAGTVTLLLANVMMNRIAGFESFGQYVFIMGLVNILGVFICFGGDTYLKRELARIEPTTTNTDIKIGEKISLMMRQTCALWIPCVVLVGIYFIYFSERQFSSGYLTLVLVGLVLMMTSMIRLTSGALIGLSGVLYEATISSLIKPLLVIFMLCILYVYYVYSPSALEGRNGLLIVQFLMLCSIFICALLLLRRKYEVKTWSLLAKLQPQKKMFRSMSGYLVLCFPLALVSSTVILERNVDIIMLGSLNNTDSSALYYVSTRISAFFLLPLFVLNSIALPIISRSFGKGEMVGVEKNAKKVSAYSSVITAVILVFLLFFGKPALLLFGEEYSSAYYPMLILCIGNFIRTLIGPVQMVGLMCNMERTVSKANMIGLLVNVMLNIVLIPIMGLYGAVIATITTRLGRTCFVSAELTRKIGVRVGVISLSR